MSESAEQHDQDLNPHRDADRERASAVAASQLRHRGIDVDDAAESSDELASLLTSVERFESAVASVGGDSMTNSLDTKQHDDESLVLPRRNADESLTTYAGRIDVASERLLGDRLL